MNTYETTRNNMYIQTPLGDAEFYNQRKSAKHQGTFKGFYF